MRQILLLLLGALFSCPSAPLRAAFILDDFDDTAEVVSPEMKGDIITTEDVGILLATRELRIAATTGIPTPTIARLDSNIASQGSMTADLLDVGATQNGGNPLFAFQFNYIFSITDVSQSGTNDAILFDFRSINGTESPTFLRVIATDNTFVGFRFEARINDLPMNSGAFTAVMPFSSFTIRGGAPGLPDFTTFKRMDFDFFFLRPNLEIQWSAQLERIRFGRVPEPSALTLGILGIGCLANVNSRRARRAAF